MKNVFQLPRIALGFLLCGCKENKESHTAETNDTAHVVMKIVFKSR